jgi:hypothetical protein
MPGIEMKIDLSPVVHAIQAGDNAQVVPAAQEVLTQGEHADVLIGRLGIIAARGDTDGHPTTTLAATAMLSRLLHTIPQPLEGAILPHERALPLFVYAMLAAANAVRVGYNKDIISPTPFYPSDLAEGRTVNEAMHNAVYNNDPLTVERLLLGLYATGADYRTVQVRTYDGISATFQNAGHPLMFAIRGFQLLDAVEWGQNTPTIIHWLVPHLPLIPNNDEPEWVAPLRQYVTNPANSVTGIRTRLSAPKDGNALPLRNLILSDADTTKVCQGVYDALMKGEASPRAVGSVIALAAADIMTRVPDGERDLFINVGHGLLFSAAVRLVFHQVQDVEALPLLFTSASYVNALSKAVATQKSSTTPVSATHVPGGGLIAPAQLETLSAQLKAQDLSGALGTARRYLRLGYDARALFATIALEAALSDSTSDQGHTMQITQAASEEFLAWPRSLSQTSAEPFLAVALRAAAFGKRHTVLGA